MLAAIRARWPQVTIEIRADSGFALQAAYVYCEAEHITYTIGLGTNARLAPAVAALQTDAETQSAAQDGTKVRLLGDTMYWATSWPYARRVVMKTEVLAKGTSTRFVVTTRDDAPASVYARYVDRGESENWIKSMKRWCFSTG